MYHFVDRITASLSDRRLGISLEGEREREMEREMESGLIRLGLRKNIDLLFKI
jgi:hypothetical protein